MIKKLFVVLISVLLCSVSFSQTYGDLESGYFSTDSPPVAPADWVWDIDLTTQDTGSGGPQAISRLDRPPFEKLESEDTFSLGVVAFHVEGIKKVVFEANGGNTHTVWASEKSINSDIGGQVDYNCTIDSRDWPEDQFVEIRAEVFPNGDGETRVHQYWLHVQNGSTYPNSTNIIYVDKVNGNDAWGGTVSNPVKTLERGIELADYYGRNEVPPWPQSMVTGAVLDASLATILLDGGTTTANTYDFRTDNLGGVRVSKLGWLEIKREDPENQLRPKLISNTVDESGFNRIKFSDVDVVGLMRLRDSEKANNFMWFDDCDTYGSSPTSSFHAVGIVYGVGYVYFTDGSIHDNRLGPTTVTLARGMDIYNIGEDTFRNLGMALNCTVDNVGTPTATYHSDLFEGPQGHNTVIENFIVYGVECTNVFGQGIYHDTKSYTAERNNYAFVNVLIEWRYIEGLAPGAHDANQSQIRSYDSNPPAVEGDLTLDHWVIRHLTHVGAPNGVGGTFKFGLGVLEGNTPNWEFHGNCIQNYGEQYSQHADWDTDNNHYLGGSVFPGTNYTTGATDLFVNPARDDYTPTVRSVLREKVPNFILVTEGGTSTRSAIVKKDILGVNRAVYSPFVYPTRKATVGAYED